MKIKNYNDLWVKFGKQQNWREYILPKRTDKEFYNEGLLQAKSLKMYFPNPKSILEFGCGVGRILKHFNCDNKIGVDVCQEYLDKINDKSITKIKTDGKTITGIEENSIDFIYSMMVFQHTNKEDHINMLNNLYKLLSNDGKIVIQFPMIESDYYKDGPFVNVYRKEEIKNYCEKCKILNYEIIQTNLVGYGDGLVSDNTKNREYFLIIKK